ncbi:MAG: acyl carrier protein [Pseudomonadota bacterium]
MSTQPAHTDEHEAANEADTYIAAVDSELKSIIADVLGLDTDDVAQFTPETGLFGHLPELDSMAVAGLLTEMEDRFDFIIEDDDVDGEMLETYGGLLEFAQTKLSEG